jgi:CubicO group peptidase (beta-lactamase class C family)
MRPRDMAKLGLLYLHNGIWDGEQLVPADWVGASLTPQRDRAYYPLTSQTEEIEWYGYLWWLWKGAWFYGYRSFQASGYGGQQVLVFPELDLILATTANLGGVDPESDIAQRTAIDELFVEVIFPALADVKLQPLERP